MVFGLGATLATLMVLGQTETTVTFSSEPNRHPVSGFGGEWDPHFWRAPNTKRGCDEKAWETVCGRIRDIGVARVRVGILPDWYEPDNDNGDAHSSDPERFTWNTEPMRSLCRHLDFCQQNGIKVTLTWWCAPVKRQSDGKPYWLAYPGVKDWCSAPNDVEECAENVVAGLAYLIDTRGYTCIDTFTFYNEPDWSFFDNENKVDFDRYVAICRAIDARLKEAGLRNRLSLDLADASSHKGWLKQSIDSLAGIADSFNVHSYVFACDDPDYPKAIRTWIRNWVEQCGDKPLATNELGTRHYKGAYSVTDLETFERAFCTSQYAILGLCEGMTGALFWGLYDQYYYDGKPDDGSNGGRMTTNLMAYIDDGWRLRPTGQAWTLVCQGARPGAKVYPGASTDSDVDAVALALGNGGTNVLIVNRATSSRSVKLNGLPGGAERRKLTEAMCFSRDGLSPLKAGNNLAKDAVTLPAESIILLKLAAV